MVYIQFASSATARPGRRSWKLCHWIARQSVVADMNLIIIICASANMLYHRTLWVYHE